MFRSLKKKLKARDEFWIERIKSVIKDSEAPMYKLQGSQYKVLVSNLKAIIQVMESR